MPWYRLLVRGEVQGTGFRRVVASIAVRLGLRGYARNLPDGSVEVVVEGGREAVEELARRIRGLKLVRVEGVDVEEVGAPGSPEGDVVRFGV